MRPHLRFLLLVTSHLSPVTLLAQAPTTLGASSLMNADAARGLIGRRTAAKKGDTLQVIVNEVMKGQYSANTAVNRTEASTVDKVSLPLVDVFSGNVLKQVLGANALLPQKILNGVLGGGTTGGKHSSSGGGVATTDNSFKGDLSVIVVDVDANGNLHVEGTRYIRVNKEVQKMTLTGVVRPDDVTPENTVTSDKIANANIEADGKGAVAAKTRRSLIGKLLDWLF